MYVLSVVSYLPLAKRAKGSYPIIECSIEIMYWKLSANYNIPLQDHLGLLEHYVWLRSQFYLSLELCKVYVVILRNIV